MSINDLVTELLVQWENNPALTPEELCREHDRWPEHAVLLEAVKLAIRDIRAADSMLAGPYEDDSCSRATPGPLQPKLPSTVPPLPVPGEASVAMLTGTALETRYRPQSFHAKGGLGEVWRAEDEELHREVALKRIQERHRSNTESLRRFVREAEITAKLQHPGVVPVHGLGRDADGRLCYAMRFVEGGTLDDALKRFHEADRQPGRDPGERSLSLRELLNRFIAVCNTVAYAHSRGILHRDLKPSNIMLGDYGETLVVDWGMAKPFARTEVERSTGEATLMPAATEDTPEGGTQYGQTMGTPAYMSPEQAAGRWDVVGPASDIFSLGATLYAVLTGQPPYRGHSQMDVLHQARHGEFPRPRQEKPDAPRALEAICLRAMALKPEDRYGTARELGADVEKWLADEIVTAWLEPFAARARRWMRRHRALVASSAAGLFVALLASVTGVFVLAATERRERGLRETAQEKEQEALEEKGRAMAAQKDAMDALRATTDQVIEKLIGAKTALGPAEKEFLESTMKRWQTFAADKGQSELAQEIRAEGMFRVAVLRQKLGQKEEVVAEYEEAIELLKKLVARFPNYRQNLAACHNNLASLFRDLGRLPDAESAFRQALTIEAKLAAESPSLPQYRQTVARCHNNLGRILADQNRCPEAEAEYRHALAIQEELAARFPGSAVYRLEWARSLNNLGGLLKQLGKRPEAEAALRRAIGIQEQIVAESPGETLYRHELALSYHNLGLLLVLTGKAPQAMATYRQALDILEKLSAEFPMVPEHRHLLAQTHSDMGNLFADLGKKPEAETAYRRAVAIQEKLVVESPAVPMYRQALADTHYNLGILLVDQGKRAEAETAYRQAVPLQEKLAADFPTVTKHRGDLATTLNNLGNLLADLGKRPEAEEAHRQALAIREKLAADFPMEPQYGVDLGGSQVNFGNLRGKSRQFQEALHWFAKGIKTLEGVRRQVDTDVTAQRYLRNAYAGRAQALQDLKRFAEAAEDWNKAVELSPEPERFPLRIYRAANRMRAGLVDAAIQDAEDLPKISHPAVLYAAACFFALAADRRNEPGGSLSKEECAKRAVALLQQAVAKGYKDAEQMKKDDDLKALRERDDFKKLVAELEAANAKKP
jgi:serine/threonine-protein kinase